MILSYLPRSHSLEPVYRTAGTLMHHDTQRDDTRWQEAQQWFACAAEPSNGHVSSPASPSAASRRTHPTLQKLASRKRGANGLIISNSADLSDTR